MPLGGLLTMGIISGAGSILSGLLGSSSADKASQEQATAAQNALNFQEQVWQQQQQNQQPFLTAGQQSIGSLMSAINSGTFGAGSLPAVPTAPAGFVAPTLAQAETTPGYQFAAQQGSKGVLEGAAAAGAGAIGGGTLKALDQYNTNLADTTYNDVFNRALSGYNANLSNYASQLAGYQTAQGAQQQEYNQMYNPAALGEGAVSTLNNTGTAVSQNVGNLMTQIGNAQAAGTVGSTNALTQGITGATSNLSQAALMSKLLAGLGGLGGGGYTNVGTGN